MEGARYILLVRPRPQLTRDLLLLSMVAAVIASDQLTKYLVHQYMTLGESIPQEGFFRFTYVTNSGGVLGLLANRTLFLSIASFLGIGVLVLFYRAHPWPGRLVRLSLGLQLGGATGNLIDRLRTGEVVDFLDVGPWPIFNVADSSIVVGIFLLMTLFLFFDGGPQQPAMALPSARDPLDRPPPEVGC